jgi:hypothetical protein
VAAASVPPATAATGRWIAAGGAVLAALSAAALVLAWNAQQRVKSLEGELVKRQQDSGAQAAEARLLAGQAQEGARDASAKLALLEARVAETSLQRTQIEELIQSMARSRDENVLADVEAAVRVALQQSAITGSAEPLVAALRQADERLARYSQPRLERVRRAVVQDLDKARAAGATDVPLLSLRLDEVIRLVDELPLLAAVDRRPAARPATAGRARLRRPPPVRWRLVGRLGGRWQAACSTGSGRGARARARDAHRHARGHAGGARAGLLPAREPQAAPAQCPPGAAEPAVRHGAVGPARRAVGAGALFRPQFAARPARWNPCARSRRRRAWSPCRGRTPRWRPSPPQRPAAELLADPRRPPCAASSGSCCCAWWRWSRPPRWAATTAW